MTAAGGPPTTLATVTQDIIGLIESESGSAAGNLTVESGLQDAGMDSAQVLSLVFRIEARYDIDLDAQDGDDLHTIGELAHLVLRRIRERS
jgi:acyl carrier protein